MNKYLGITIGPVIKTLMMARKPRELFSASYLLSYLTKCILEQLRQKGGGTILSPAYDDVSENSDNELTLGIGLYPDRIFYRYGEIDVLEVEQVWNDALNLLVTNIFGGKEEKFLREYLKFSALEIDAVDDKTAVQALNKLLDNVELSNFPIKDENKNPVLELIRKKSNSLLFKQALGSVNYEIRTLGEIAVSSLEKNGEKDSVWEICKDIVKSLEYDLNRLKEFGRKINNAFGENFYESNIETASLKKDVDSNDIFYDLLKRAYSKDFKSYHKYICVVQADGDNMGKIVNDIDEGSLIDFSNDLIQFDKFAAKEIEEYGGMNIYAGGDDLLFIAPVVGKNGNIFNLLDKIDALFKNRMYEGEVCKYSKKYLPSMSYGISITYYKYPLYEALEQARNLLFLTAKSVPDKNAVAWTLQKNSGSSVHCVIGKNTEVKRLLEELIEITGEDNNFISVIAHKIRANRNILKLIIQSKDYQKRLVAFSKGFLDLENKTGQEQLFLKKIQELMETLIVQYRKSPWELLVDSVIPNDQQVGGFSMDMVWGRLADKLTSEVYCILRTVKFLKGMEENHE